MERLVEGRCHGTRVWSVKGWWCQALKPCRGSLAEPWARDAQVDAPKAIPETMQQLVTSCFPGLNFLARLKLHAETVKVVTLLLEKR